MKKINIAIDGPSSAGKSSVAKLAAKKLNYKHIDTGAMYRSLMVLLLEKKIDFHNEKKVLKIMKKDFDFKIEGERFFLNEVDVTDKIRAREINENISTIVSYKKMRKEMVKQQQSLAKEKGFIMDGRDISSVVLKDAELKIYLNASIEQRAKRRYLENKEKGNDSSYEQVLENLKKRDYIDTYVSKALVKTKDAIEIDTTNLTIDEVINKIVELAKERINK